MRQRSAGPASLLWWASRIATLDTGKRPGLDCAQAMEALANLRRLYRGASFEFKAAFFQMLNRPERGARRPARSVSPVKSRSESLARSGESRRRKKR